MEEQKITPPEHAKHDYELVKATLNGNGKAYARLLSQYKDAIYFKLLKMVNNPNDAEDLTLEAFIKAYNNLHLYSPSYAFSTWLFRIATNNCIDFLRKRKGIHISIENNGETENSENIKLKSKELNPEEQLIKEQRAEMLRKIVRRLKPRYQKLVELRYFKEYSYEEIAKELALPLGTVKAQLFRSRAILFKMIGSNEIAENG